MRAGAVIGSTKDPVQTRLKLLLVELVPHLSAENGGIGARSSAAPTIEALYALAGLRLVRLNDSAATPEPDPS